MNTQNLQPEHLINEVPEVEATCTVCGEMLEPVFENNGFNEPGAEHYDFIGYKLCEHGE